MIQEAEFIVGNNEESRISYTLNKWFGSFTLKINGRPSQYNDLGWRTGPFTVEIGEMEKHNVTIMLIIPARFPYYTKTGVQIMIDGMIIENNT